MSRELEALEEIQNHKIKLDINIKYDNGDETQYRFETIRDMFPKQFAIIETALKALEIIKEKGLDILEFRHAFSLYEYNACKNIGCEELTQEEYDLLKEV